MGKTENRYIRIEDWKGNVYFPESNSSSSTAGSVSDSESASKDATGTNPKTDGDKVTDSSANNGTAIMVSSSSTRQTLFSTYLSNVPFGNVSVGVRMKSSIATGTTPLVELNTYFVDASGEDEKYNATYYITVYENLNIKEDTHNGSYFNKSK